MEIDQVFSVHMVNKWSRELVYATRNPTNKFHLNQNSLRDVGGETRRVHIEDNSAVRKIECIKQLKRCSANAST